MEYRSVPKGWKAVLIHGITCEPDRDTVACIEDIGDGWIKPGTNYCCDLLIYHPEIDEDEAKEIDECLSEYYPETWDLLKCRRIPYGMRAEMTRREMEVLLNRRDPVKYPLSPATE